MPLTRRQVALQIAAFASLGALPADASTDPIELEWEDLIPAENKGLLYETLQGLGIVEHGQISTPFDQEAASAVVTEYNGKLVRIPGFAVPLDFAGTAVSTFVLVPYFGACIHVPPPPPNQLVFVQTKTPFEGESMWDPIYATGIFGAAATATQLAEVGYAMTEAEITPYE